jgi:hypothetical protein
MALSFKCRYCKIKIFRIVRDLLVYRNSKSPLGDLGVKSKGKQEFQNNTESKKSPVGDLGVKARDIGDLGG